MKTLKVGVLVALIALVGHAQERSMADATYALKGLAQKVQEMPRACPVEPSRSLLREGKLFSRCHGLVPWSLTFPAK